MIIESLNQVTLLLKGLRMIKEALVLILLKGSGEKVTEHIHQNEIDCNCSYESCTRTIVDESVLKSFEKLRKDFGREIYINSFFRCEKWNEEVGGKHSSYHKIGHAIDIKATGRGSSAQLAKIAEKYFDVVIEYKKNGRVSFVHVHNYSKANDLPICFD